MTTQDDLSNDDVLHIAKLANLPIDESNVEKYKKQLTETIHYVENLDELDTTDVQPTSHSTRMTNVYFKDGTKDDRQFSQDQATQNAPHVKKGMMVVKRIME